ncbi:MFS transporter [Nonomuraea sp. NPDC050556]|uniref:MFS transporter n=1 Tax=Nonomuraea sp. NPDC050556 TaxID=3364369 RepID=UPI0037B0DD6C
MIRTYLVRALDLLATSLMEFALPLIVLSTTGSTALAGLSYVAEWVPRILAIPRAGALVDRWGAGRVFVLASAARVTLGAVAVTGLILWPSAWWLALVFGAASGALFETTFIAGEALTSALCDARPDDTARIQGRQGMVDEITMLCGPLMAAFLVQAGVVAALALVTVLALLAGVLARPLSPVRPAPVEEPRGALTTAIRVVRAHPVLLWVMVAQFPVNLVFALLTVGAPAVIMKGFGQGETAVGALWTVASVVSLLGIKLAERGISRGGLLRTGLVTLAVTALGGVGAGLSSGFPAFFVCAALATSTLGAVMTFLRTIRSKVIPQESFGATISLMVLVALLANPLAGLLVAVVPSGGLQPLLAVSGTLALVAVVIAISRMRTETRTYVR